VVQEQELSEASVGERNRQQQALPFKIRVSSLIHTHTQTHTHTHARMGGTKVVTSALGLRCGGLGAMRARVAPKLVLSNGRARARHKSSGTTSPYAVHTHVPRAEDTDQSKA
jgi:hypothetical protein